MQNFVLQEGVDPKDMYVFKKWLDMKYYPKQYWAEDFPSDSKIFSAAGLSPLFVLI